MTISNARRLQAYESLEANLGSDAAETIMELLPTFPETDLATRADLYATSTELRGEMAELRGEMAELRGEMAELGSELRGEMAELRSELRGEMAELRSELRGEMAKLRIDVMSEMSRRFDAQTRWGVALIGSNVAALVAAIIT